MDYLQFSLFFIALLVGYVLVHLRLVRLEQYLREIAGSAGNTTVVDQLRQGNEALGRLRLDRVENLLQRLHEDLDDLREATTSVEQAVVRIPPPPVREVASASAAETPGQRLRALVETRLLQLGYSDLRLLTDVDSVPATADVEVQVECLKNRMPCKGRVLLRNGALRDVQLQTIVQSFP